MNLPYQVTVQPPAFTYANGTVREFPAITLSSLDVTIMDNASHRHCAAQIRQFPVPLLLWRGEEYDAAGDYTQAQVDARVLELLGPDVAAGLKGLLR